MPPLAAVVDHHHEVLLPWSELRRKLAEAPTVWCLDYHTDTMPCFRNALPPPENGAYLETANVTAAISRLRHDEHFDWALRAGVIKEAFIGIAGEDCKVTADEKLQVFRDETFPPGEIILNHPEEFRPFAETVLESSFLQKLFPRLPAPGESYILDIDCDFFLCGKALQPQDDTIIRKLAANAALVTLSRESDWVRILKLPGEEISGEYLAAEFCRNFLPPPYSVSF